MTANIIQFPGKQVAAPLPAPLNEKVRDDSAPTKVPARRGSKARSDGRRINHSKYRSVEPNIQKIPGEDGGCSYRVQIRKTVQGESVSFTKTFSKLAMARKWKKRKLAEIELNGVQAVSKKGDTVAHAITARLAKHKHLGSSARQQLNWLKKSDFGKKKLTELSLESLTDLADDMLAEDRQPQTVAGYLSILVNTLYWASRRNFIVPVAALKEAMEHMWEDEILARSEERNRRPTMDELDKILGAACGNKRQKIPLAKIIVFAIFSCRRLGEICRLRWEDLRIEQKKILVRDMKHPRKKKGNDVWCNLTDEALAVILSMPREGDFIFPFNARSVGAAWRRHRVRLNIRDLRFHDLRHEGITRLFEMGMPAAFVAKHSGHKNGGCLYRYEHVEKEGDKFAGWQWSHWATRGSANIVFR
ncbi:Phage integrase family protein [Roseovarius sp. THAF9]|uniref:tyrosine-type recombinase/integrase n=1 Tax=Roseovarius sp. THAF9 TaxID=2587847 RepID=UPI0012A8A177|nr:site-specific integrase [Roseovarius sp. THAF9]QFT93581.1 Phage integrase family protein [Roseovarius sp. THAF9]